MIFRHKIIVWFLAAVIFILPGVIFAADESANDRAQEPTVEIKPPDSYLIRKIMYFPLDIPIYAVQAVTWPIGMFFNFLDDNNVIQKTTDFLSNKDKTFFVYPIIEGGAGAGFGGGVGVRDTNLFNREYLFGASYKNHINLNQQAQVSFGKLSAFHIASRPVSFSTGVSWNQLLSESYYGIGNSSAQSNSSAYSLNGISVGGTLAYSVFDSFNFALHTAYSSDHTYTRKEGWATPVQDTFPPSQLIGFGSWLDYVDIGAGLTHDTRDNLLSTQSGALRSLSFDRFQCANLGVYSYNSLNLDIRQYIKLWHPRQVLILRTNWAFQSTFGDDVIPFWRLTKLDTGTFLRGFPGGRFRDRSSLLFNIEYRYPLWKMFDGVLFYDTGRVFPSIKDVSLDHIKYSVGGGINFFIPKLAMFHFHAAYGGEGINILFGTSQQL